MSQPLYIGEDNVVRWDRAKTAAGNAYVNSGVFTYQLKDGAANVLASGSLTYVTGTHGRWQAAIDKASLITVVEGDTYWLEVTASDGSGADGFRRVECLAQYHREAP